MFVFVFDFPVCISSFTFCCHERVVLALCASVKKYYVRNLVEQRGSCCPPKGVASFVGVSATAKGCVSCLGEAGKV